MLNSKEKYRVVYYDGFLFPKRKPDVSLYRYLESGLYYLSSSDSMVDKTLTLLKIHDGAGEQLILTVDRDFYTLNWQTCENNEKVKSVTIKYWQSLSQFEDFSYKNFELWVLNQFDMYRDHRKDRPI